MTRSFRAFTATLLLITPLLAGCADLTEPTDTRPSVERQELLGVIGGVIGGVVNLLGAVLGIVVGGPEANAAAVTKTIGLGGGTLTTGAYTLTVPAGAVTQNTVFGITPANNGTYSIDLSATRKTLLSKVNVGAQGFNRPVTFKISYAGADNVKDPSKLVIVYVRPDGTSEPQPSKIDTSTKSVSSTLSHFSKYALVQN